MANYTRNDLINAMLAIRDSIKAKGGTVTVANANPTPAELKAGVDSIQLTSIENATGYAIVTAELAGVTLTLSKDGTTIDTQETPATTGGVVTFAPTETGTYTITATAGGTTKWTNTIAVTGIGTFNCKSGLNLRDYALADINTACKNKYAKYMFKLGDYFIADSFMGSTSQDYTKCYLVDFDNQVDENGNAVGATFEFVRTPSTYKYNETTTNRNNGISYIGSGLRAKCCPSGTVQYIYDTSVNASTSGTYYVYDNTLRTFESKTLPDEFVANTKYYIMETTSSDGVIYAGIPQNIKDIAVASKQTTWGGYGGLVTNSTNAWTDTTTIDTVDKFWVPSCEQLWGNKMFISTTSSVWGYRRQMEGAQFGALRNMTERSIQYMARDFWQRSPATNYASGCCAWSNGYGNVGYNLLTNGSAVPLCFCL